MARLFAEAQSRGGNAIIAMRFDTTELGGNWSEICAYGTAVVAIPVTDAAKQTAAQLGYGRPGGSQQVPPAGQPQGQPQSQPFPPQQPPPGQDPWGRPTQQPAQPQPAQPAQPTQPQPASQPWGQTQYTQPPQQPAQPPQPQHAQPDNDQPKQ
jgi:hypothetical protein